MGDTFTIAGLRRKRAYMAGEIELAENKLAKCREQLAKLDAVILMFDPNADPDTIVPMRAYIKRRSPFRRGEVTRLLLRAMSKAGQPMRVSALVEHVLAAKGLTLDDDMLKKTTEVARFALRRLTAQGKVCKLIKWPETWYELVA